MFRTITLSALCLISVALKAEVQWETSFDEAVKKAKAENKVILADFTGSDWCIWCKRLNAEVFSQADFAKFAAEKLVMLEVDFPRRKPQSAEMQEANARLASKYNIEGYPTVLLFDSNGRQIARTGYREGGASAYIKHLTAIAHLTPVSTTKTAGAPAPSAVPNKAKPLAPITAPPSVQYNDLELKGISGAANHRLVLLNNKTLAAGEKAKVKLGGKEIVVLCKEIKDHSAVLEIDNRTIELKLGEKGGAAKIAGGSQ